MRRKKHQIYRRAAFLLAAASNGLLWADAHPSNIPVLSSKPGAAYTIYLDFAGFNYNGSWGSATPGVMSAYGNVTTNFSSSQQTTMEQIWAAVSEKYAEFNINVTTVDPAVSAGQASTDAARQSYYDKTGKIMHTIIAGSSSSWSDGGVGGVSFVGETKLSGVGNGLHTNFVFTKGVGTSEQIVGEAAAHENGHGLGLSHQADYIGTTEEQGYSDNNGSTGTGSFTPTMGVSYYSQRGLWRAGTYEGGGGAFQNDVKTIEANTGIGAYTEDGVGNTLATASLLPLAGTIASAEFARGIIIPTSTSSPSPNLSSGFTTDYYSFNSTGGSVSLTVHNGAERIAFGSADPGATLHSLLTIYNSSGGTVGTASESFSNQTETFTQTLPTGQYYAAVSEVPDYSSFDTPAYYYGMGSFFITGSGLSGGLATNLYFVGGATTTKWNQIDSASNSNWATDATGATDPVQTPSADVNVYLSANSATGVSSTTLGASTSINSLTFTGTGTAAATTPITIAADGSTLTIIALASNTNYQATGLTVLSGALADTIATPVVLGSSQIWAVNNAAANPLTVTGIVSDGGKGYGLTKTGVGTLVLSAANTFSGNSLVSGGSVLLKNSLALQNVTVNASGGTIAFDSSVASHAFTIGALGGSSNLSLNDNGSNAVALTTGGDGDSTTLSGIISGAGSLTLIGGGEMDLTGANTFAGTRTIGSGTLGLSGNQNASTGSIIMTGDSTNDAETLNLISGGTTVAAGNSIQIGNSNGAYHSNATFNSSGSMTNGGGLTIARAGVLTLNSGASWIQNGGMTIEGIGGYGSTATINTGASFTYNGSSAISMTDGASGAASTIAIAGGTLTTSKNFNLASHGTGTDNVTLSSGGNIVASANITDLFTTSVSGANIAFLVDTGGGNLNTSSYTVGISDKITGTGLLTKTGTGLLTLSAANPWTGGINISSGAVLATNSASLGTGPVAILSGGTSTASLQLSGGITITNTLAGFASEAGGNTPTIENISGNNTITSPLSITSTGGNGAIFQSDSGTLNLSGGLTTTLTSSRIYYLQGAGNGLVSSDITDSASNILALDKEGTGTWTLTGNDTYTRGTTVGGGTLIFASPGALPAFTSLSVTGTAIATAHTGLTKNSLFASGLTLAGSSSAWTGKLDLTNNDLVVRNGSLDTLTDQVKQGYNTNGPTWQASGGITSSTAATDPTHLTALGIIQNSTTGLSTGPAIYNSFDGQPVFNVDVLVKYTYFGDADLDGSVTSADYTLIDNGYLSHLTGWYNGDFNYDSAINGSDYTLIDNAFNTQAAQLSAQFAAPTSQIASVPEPATLSLTASATLLLLTRRRR